MWAGLQNADLRRPAELLEAALRPASAQVSPFGSFLCRCDPGPGLDLTRDLECWVRVSWRPDKQTGLMLVAGAGVGRKGADGDLCVSAYARDLLERNLLPLDRGLTVEVVLPRGRELALRTSNAAFGVVDGLALIGTQAEVQRSATPDQLKQVLLDLTQLTGDQEFQGDLVLVIGENGLDLARQAQLAPLLKVGNWLGPVLVAAARRAKKRGNDGGQGKRKGSKSKKAFLQSNFKPTLAL